MEYTVICIAFYLVLILLGVVPKFKAKPKKTNIFTISVLSLTTIFNILVGFNVKIGSPMLLFEKAMSAIFRI